MEERPKEKGWWQTVPGILTATAGIITAVTGLIVALNQAGFFERSERKAPPTPSTAERPQPKAELPSPPATTTGRATASSSSVPPAPAAPSPGSPAAPARVNLLAPENGGQLVLAPSDAWGVTIDGKEESYREVRVGEEAVYAFKDERAARFNAFSMLIPRSGRNPKEFELFAGDSPTGPYRSLGVFQPLNLRVMKTAGWQEFGFPPVTARYLKVTLRSNHEDVVWIQLYEFQLWGNPDGK